MAGALILLTKPAPTYCPFERGLSTVTYEQHAPHNDLMLKSFLAFYLEDLSKASAF